MLPFEATPCASCKLKDEDGVGVKCFNELAAPVQEPFAEFPVFADEAKDVAPEGLMPVAVLSRAMSELMAMSPASRDVVCLRFAGLTYREIAERQGCTAAAVEWRQWRAMQQWPALRALFAEKAAKQLRRKPYGSGAKQGKKGTITAVGGGVAGGDGVSGAEPLPE